MARHDVAAFGSRVLSAAVLIALGVVAWRRRWPAEYAMLMLVFVLLLCSPVVHPWYLLWLYPLAIASNHRPALVWTAVVVLAFWGPGSVLDGGDWSDPVPLRVIEYGAVAGSWIWARPRRAGVRADTAPVTLGSG